MVRKAAETRQQDKKQPYEQERDAFDAHPIYEHRRGRDGWGVGAARGRGTG